MMMNQNPCNMQNFNVINNNILNRGQFNENPMNQNNNIIYANTYFNYLTNMINNMNFQNNCIMNNSVPINKNFIYNSMINPMNNQLNNSICNSLNSTNISMNNQMNNSFCNSTPNSIINPMRNSMNLPLNMNNNMMMPFNMNNSNENYTQIYEQNLIFSKICEIFFSQEALSLKTEKDVLNFFAEGEEKCSNYIIDNPFNYNKISLKNYMESIIEFIFKNSLILNWITPEIYSKLNDIYVERLKSSSEYFKILQIIFGDVRIPEFLIYRDLEKISENLRESTESLENLMNNFCPETSHPILDIYNKIRKKKLKPLNGINTKYELFILFISINNNVFHKNYGNALFFDFLKVNEKEVQRYFGNNFKYQSILEEFNSITNSEEYIKREELFQIIEKEINKEKDKIYNIISSFYYLLIHVFKDNKQKYCLNNLGNVYINLLLKNLAIFFDEKYKNLFLRKNLFYLLKDIYFLDIKYLIKINKYPSEYNYYSFEQIDQLLREDEISKQYYLDKKAKLLDKNYEDFISIISAMNKAPYQEKIRLSPVNINVKTNSITILVDGFMSEDDNPKRKWKAFLDYFKNNETMFYFYGWPASNLSVRFNHASERASLCGYILAYLLISQKFKHFQINLIGFSLGNQIIKHCLKALYKIFVTSGGTHFANLKNIIFIAGATQIKNVNKWKTIFKKLIGDRIINCYSNSDYALKWLYKAYKSKTAIGSGPLLIEDNENSQRCQLVENYEFFHFHITYDYKEIVSKIFKDYKDI